MSVPSYVFSREWLERPFIVPNGKRFRTFLRLKFETWVGYGIMWRQGNEHVRVELLRRIKILCPLKQWNDIDVPAYLFSKEWRDGNITILSDGTLRKEARADLANYVNSETLHLPQHASVLKEVRACLAAIDAYNKASM